MKYLLISLLGIALGAAVADFKPEWVEPMSSLVQKQAVNLYGEKQKEPLASKAFQAERELRDYYYVQRLNAAKYLALQQELFWKKRQKSKQSVSSDLKWFMHPEDFDLLMAACPLGYPSCRNLVDSIKQMAKDNPKLHETIFRQAYFGVYEMAWVIKDLKLEEKAAKHFADRLGFELRRLGHIKSDILLKNSKYPEQLILAKLEAGSSEILEKIDVSTYDLTSEQIHKALIKGWGQKSSMVYNRLQAKALLGIGHRPALDLLLWSFTDDVEKPVFMKHIHEKVKDDAMALFKLYAPRIDAQTDKVAWYNKNYNKLRWDSSRQQFN